ncbi:DUF1611 domain-containing protein [Laspinema sp. A4]|uniref:DUF1611 domain-containing protein n=1 Tax=Laspinema sp. D2d TaxID=2953686 RepID=UPI0021BA730C|nr:DUF1611 domain-containing protein [Laspinema sp. D2d]MCT7986159.1 DUF1611 domain-containing protein [Laspinema sp. D2d]
MRITANHRVAILQHQGILGSIGKTGLTLLRYSEGNMVAVIDRESAGQSLQELTGIARDVPIVASVDAALAMNPDVLAIGIAPPGGAVPAEWVEELRLAVSAGLSIVNGLHTPLNHHPELPFPLREGQWIWDVRQEPTGLKIGSAQARQLTCPRVLTVGTDMAIGKMSTCLEIHRLAQQRGLQSQFVATGQAGLMIAGTGVALDAVRVDFAAGAVEQAVMQCATDCDLILVEGQGSLFHPGSTATLPLLRGSQPTHLVLVHRAGQTHIKNHPHVPIPGLPEAIALYEQVASAAGALTPSRVVAVALNSRDLDEAASRKTIQQIEAETGLPCTDPVRFGPEKLLNAILAP